jgi:NAD-dependent SIR2 family protein deacetylase
MSSGVPNGKFPSLLHFHVCIHCTSRFRREELEERAQMTGLIVCSACGREGPLNIEILETNRGESGRAVAR